MCVYGLCACACAWGPVVFPTSFFKPTYEPTFLFRCRPCICISFNQVVRLQKKVMDLETKLNEQQEAQKGLYKISSMREIGVHINIYIYIYIDTRK